MPGNGRLLLCADDPEAVRLSDIAPCAVESFGLVADADWCAENIRYEARATIFDVRHRGDEIGTVTLPLLGRFNVRNALGATAASVSAGASCASVLDALSTFRGVRRRLEVRGVARGITVYDDFAHHPTAVRETLQALRATPSDGRVWAVFEPRSATACRKVFQKEFVDALQHADEVLVSDVYRSALPAAERLSVADLVAELTERGVSARHVPGVDEIVSIVTREAGTNDRVVLMSNGAFGGIHERMLSALSA